MDNIYIDKLGTERILAICKEFNVKNDEVKKVRMALSMYAEFYSCFEEKGLSDEEIADIVSRRVDDKDSRILRVCSEIILESELAHVLDGDDWYDPAMAN